MHSVGVALGRICYQRVYKNTIIKLCVFLSTSINEGAIRWRCKDYETFQMLGMMMVSVFLCNLLPIIATPAASKGDGLSN